MSYYHWREDTGRPGYNHADEPSDLSAMDKALDFFDTVWGSMTAYDRGTCRWRAANTLLQIAMDPSPIREFLALDPEERMTVWTYHDEDWQAYCRAVNPNYDAYIAEKKAKA